ncbi:hypothetical protein [Listeria innocua]|uniref:hypothetical protein n=1 Tax=Listeria innocua TaxID=1642 RepID=UPI0016237B57|nr:hypothetical protein [Listeria innocua]EBF5152411.1 hypothetical protein [Listeria monocytogenes]MBC1904740.1 hypothetical protein [Listeria innocua]MBC2137575.1 hypothetical protein [Listeria innocua]MBC2140582.1 hypothetical protein [Listeria innocua]
MDSKTQWYKKAEKDNWKTKFKVIVKSVKGYSENNYAEFLGEVIEHQSKYMRKNPSLIPLFKGYVKHQLSEGDVLECIGRGRLGYKSGHYEISFIKPKSITLKENLVEVIEILSKPTGEVERSNGEIRYYVRHGDLNATHSQSTSYDGIMKSLEKVRRSSLMTGCGSYILKELNMRNKSNSPVTLARKYWEYRPVGVIKNNKDYKETNNEAEYKIIEFLY